MMPFHKSVEWVCAHTQVDEHSEQSCWCLDFVRKEFRDLLAKQMVPSNILSKFPLRFFKVPRISIISIF